LSVYTQYLWPISPMQCFYAPPYRRLPVNSSHGQLVTQSTRHTVNSSQVNSSPGRLVTRSTRHKKAVNSSQAKASKHQSRTTAVAVITLTLSPRSPQLLNNCTRK